MSTTSPTGRIEMPPPITCFACRLPMTDPRCWHHNRNAIDRLFREATRMASVDCAPVDANGSYVAELTDAQVGKLGPALLHD